MATITTGNAAGTITVVIGDVKIVGVDGVVRVAKVGDAVFMKEVIETGADGIIQIRLADGRTLDKGRDSKLALEADLLVAEAALEVGSAPDAERRVDGGTLTFTAGSDDIASIVFGETVGISVGGLLTGSVVWSASGDGRTLTGFDRRGGRDHAHALRGHLGGLWAKRCGDGDAARCVPAPG